MATGRPTGPADLREQQYQEKIALREAEEAAAKEKRAAKRRASFTRGLTPAQQASTKARSVARQSTKPRAPKLRKLVEDGKVVVVAPGGAKVTATVAAIERSKLKYPTREAWLVAAVRAQTADFREAGAEVPDLRVSIGWPAGRSAKGNTIGQCFQSPSVADGQPALFISPVLTDPVQILAVLRHEMVHAVVEVSARPHQGPFAKLAAKLGLVKPWTATTPDEALTIKLQALAEKLGPFGHSQVTKGGMKGRIVQSTRMLKVVCPACGYTVRTTRKWLDEGLPSCPQGDEMQEEAGKG